MTTQTSERGRWRALLPIIQAYIDGETIEILDRHGLWSSAKFPNFTGRCDQYRVKPQPEYRPYEDGELIGLIGKVVHHIGGARSMITGAHEDRVYCEGRPTTSKALLEHFTFLDGSRCGVLNEGQ